MIKKAFILSVFSLISYYGICQDLTDLSKSVVKVVYTCQDPGKVKSGTGFVWKKGNHIVTALHLVIGECSGGSVKILLPSNSTPHKNVFYNARIIKILKSADLALLEADVPPLTPLREKSSTLFVKQNVDVIGYPLGASGKRSIPLSIPFNESKRLRANVPPAAISELNKIGFSADMEVVHFNGSLLPGLSGAPVLNSKGQVIAVGNGGLNGGQVGITWGIPSSRIEELENSTESVNNIDAPFKKSSALAFSAELTLDIRNIDADFLSKEKEELRKKDMFLIQEMEFFKVATKPFSEILEYSNDQDALTLLINTFKDTNLQRIEFDIYKNFETGASFLLPGTAKIIQKETSIEIQSAVHSVRAKLEYYPLLKSYDITDELCISGKINRPIDSTSFWMKSPNWSYQFPITTFDGQYINREGYAKAAFINNSSKTEQISFQFVTTAKKNKDLFFYTVSDDEGNTQFNQSLVRCIQNQNNIGNCHEVLKKWNEIAGLVFCQYLFSFSI